MEGTIQRTASQNEVLDGIDATNNNNNNSVKLNNTKPPILPKPLIVKLDSGVHIAVKSNVVSPTVCTAINGSEKIRQRTLHQFNKNELESNVAENERLSQRPLSISPKPQVPPKSNLSHLIKKGFVTPGNSVAPKTLESCSDSSSALENLSERSQKTLYDCLKSVGTESCGSQKKTINNCDLSQNWVLSKQKSASLGRNEIPNWKVTDLINDVDQLSKFCKQVEMCSRHSHLLKNDSEATFVDLKSKLEQLDLISNHNSSNINDTTNHISAEASASPSSFNGTQFSLTDSYVSENMNHVITQRERELTNSEAEDSQVLSKGFFHLSNIESPQSFLHHHINLSNQLRESVQSKKPEIKNVHAQSFLHKNKEQTSQCLSKSTSSEQRNDENTLNVNKALCMQDNEDKSLQADKGPVTNIKRSDQSFWTHSSNSDGLSFSKRFPWFGSFGKGNKKEAGKKGRCISQFYSSTTEMDHQIFKNKTRTKSLPDIKHSRTPPDGNFILKNPQTPTITKVTAVNNDYAHSDSDDDKDSLNQMEMNVDKDCNSSTRAYLKAKELMTSEEVFIDVLKLLNVDFRNYVQFKNFELRNSCIPMTEVSKILNHLSQLQSLNEDILDDLRKRIENWENNPKISDVIVKKGAFLKMYTTYIQNFESQTNYLDECMVKYPKFGKIVREFEASERCKKLTLKHYMLKPVQRIPQYRLLLNDYLKYLEETSLDYEDTLTALKIVSEVVDHANRNLAHGDKEGRLMHFQSILSDYVLIKPGRELIKDGFLEKICRKSVKDRYFILLNDCLLHTTYSKQYMKIHQELPLSGMKIFYNDDQKFPHSFTVHSIKRSFILCAKNEKNCKEWVEKLQNAIAEYIKKQKTFFNVQIEVDNTFKLGKEAPVWVPDSKVTMCQICTAEFTALFRRHHCRGCGKVVCRNCGSNQAPLQYANFKTDRVCDQCFDLLIKDYEDSENNICNILKEMLNLNEENVQNEYLSIKAKFVRYSSANSFKKPKNVPKRLKEVSANDTESAISGWLCRKSRKSWKMFWYVLKERVLYVYKASEDVLALQTIPVLGYEVVRADVCDEESDKKLVFSLVHPSQSPLVFRAESQASADRWFDALTAASNFDHMSL